MPHSSIVAYHFIAMPPKLPPPPVLETCLYTKDLPRAVKFYTELFGYEPLESDARFCAMSVAGKQVLILFLEGGTKETVHLHGGEIPPHDGSGTTHIAFSVSKEDLPCW